MMTPEIAKVGVAEKVCWWGQILECRVSGVDTKLGYTLS